MRVSIYNLRHESFNSELTYLFENSTYDMRVLVHNVRHQSFILPFTPGQFDLTGHDMKFCPSVCQFESICISSPDSQIYCLLKRIEWVAGGSSATFVAYILFITS